MRGEVENRLLTPRELEERMLDDDEEMALPLVLEFRSFAMDSVSFVGVPADRRLTVHVSWYPPCPPPKPQRLGLIGCNRSWSTNVATGRRVTVQLDDSGGVSVLAR